METLRNALGFFEENGQIIVKKDRSGRQEAAMTLHPDWVPKQSEINTHLTIDVCLMERFPKTESFCALSRRSRFRDVRGKIGLSQKHLNLTLDGIIQLFQDGCWNWRIGLVSPSESKRQAWRQSSRVGLATFLLQNPSNQDERIVESRNCKVTIRDLAFRSIRS